MAFIVVLSSLFGIGIALAAPGDLDPGFGEDGLWSLTIDGSDEQMPLRSFSKAMASSFWRAAPVLIIQLQISSLCGWQQTGHWMPGSVPKELRPSISVEPATLQSQ